PYPPTTSVSVITRIPRTLHSPPLPYTTLFRSTGISAADRAHTIKAAASPKATPADIVQPGHVFPLIAQAGGVLVRAGHTEACCEDRKSTRLNSSHDQRSDAVFCLKKKKQQRAS